MEQKMKLAPRMIQSMEILQLPILALQERIEQEINSNPVLELDEQTPSSEAQESVEEDQDEAENEGGGSDGEKIEDFSRLESLDDEFKEHINEAEYIPSRPRNSETDRKLEAIKNTAAPSQSLHDFLTEQWRMFEVDAGVKEAGYRIIDYINDKGYLTVRIEQLHSRDEKDYSFEDLQRAAELVKELDPPGVGASDVRECLLIQMRQSDDNTEFEEQLVGEHMDDLLANRLPDIAREMDCDVEQVNQAIRRLSRYDTSPGLQIGQDNNRPISADVVVEWSEEEQDFTVRLADNSLPQLRLSDYYTKMVRDSQANEKTKKFLKNNIRSAQWIIEAIEQRKNTLLKVTRAVVAHQKGFFEKGQLYLKPLPMSTIADEVGVHVATVSRAVAGKYLQYYWGVMPLRKFFSGGTEDQSGNARSWEAIRGRLQQIIDSEDKSKPLSDDRIRGKLAEGGINHIARRTIAKYRKIMGIPSARLRKQYHSG